MCALEKVIIEVKGDVKLDPTIAKLQKIGKVDKNNAQQFKKSSKEFQDSTKKSGSLMKGLGKQALVLGTALVGAFAIKQVVGNAINIIKDFEKEMSTLRSITGSTAKEMEFFKKAAFEIGRATKTAGIEVVKAFTIIGSAQPELLKNQKALAAVTEQALILAQAAGIDTVQAADALTSAMNQFGASADDAAKFTDIFATSQQKGSSFIIDTAEALKLVGASADAVGLSFETTNAAIQALAKGALRGSIAGTSLNAVLAQLSKQNDDKINPSIVGLSAALEELEKRNLSFKEATALVQIEGAKGLLTLIKQRDIFEELNGSLNETGNAMEQMRINTDNLDSSLSELGDAFEELSVKAGENTGILQRTADFATSLIQAFSGTGAEAFRLGKAFGFSNIELALLRKEMGTWADVVNILNIRLDELGLEVEEFGVTMKPNVEGAISVSEALDKWRRAAKGLSEEIDEDIDIEKKSAKTVGELMKEISELRTSLKDTVPKSEAYREKLARITEIQNLLRVSTEKSLTPLKLFQKVMVKLKEELEEQALVGALSSETLNKYAEAVKKAETATKLLNDAIADESSGIKRLKPIVEDQLELEEAVDMSREEFFVKNKKRADDERADIIATQNLRLEAISAVGSLSIEVANIRTGLLQRELQEEEEAFDIKKEALQKQLDDKLISEKEFTDKKIDLEKDFDEKRAEIQTKQAKANKLASIFEAIIATAVGVVKALQIPPPAGEILAIERGVIGAAQLIAIAAQPIPKFHKGKRGELSDEEFPALIRRSEYVIPPEQSRRHRQDLDAMLGNKFDKFVFMKYQMPIIKQHSKSEQSMFSDFDITQHQRKHSKLLEENNQLLRQMLPTMKRASIGWD